MTRGQTAIKRKRLRIALGVVLSAILLVCAGFAVYVGDYYHANQVAAQAMATVDDITVSKADGDAIVFAPSSPKAGLIFYPGGKYGPQKGDGTPVISGEEQVMRTACEIADIVLDVGR